MDAAQPGLFDLSDEDPSAARTRSAVRGRNRETWARTASAVVTIIDAAAVHQAAANVNEVVLPYGLGATLDAEDTEPAMPEPRPDDDALDALAWLIWPTDGLEALLEAGAFRILSMESEVVAQTADRGTVTWTVAVKLTHVDELRRLATEAHPDEAALISDSLEVAWQHAADPFAPLRSIPGISWRPEHVYVEHQRARAGRKG